MHARRLEFFYAKAPASMRSLCSAFHFVAMSLACYVNTLGRAATASCRAGRNKATGLADEPETNMRESALQTYARTPSSAVARPLALRWPMASTIDCTSRAAGRQHAHTYA
jgi:hypothetical protein